MQTFFKGSPIDHRYSIEILICDQDVLRCSQMFTDVFRDLIRLLNEMDIGIKANKHYNETNTYTSSSSWSDLLVSVLCLHPF